MSFGTYMFGVIFTLLTITALEERNAVGYFFAAICFAVVAGVMILEFLEDERRAREERARKK